MTPLRTKIVLAAVVLATFAGSYVLRERVAPGEGQCGDRLPQARRIVSMAPSVTETLFALGLGDRVVGVTRFCTYPPEVKDISKIGGFQDPNYEAILGLNPDLVVLLQGRRDDERPFRKLGIPTLAVCHTDIEGIFESIEAIGRACGAEDRARQILDDIHRRLDRVARKTAGRPRPRVLLAIQRAHGTGTIENLCVAGRDGHIDRVIELAGGRNANPEGTVRFPIVSTEGIMQISPQVIIDMAGWSAQGVDPREALADWRQFPQIDAVRDGRVYVIDDEFAFVPGPRVVLLVEKLARLLHPEVDW
jgi:iron complex transport system substrate-binding protein